MGDEMKEVRAGGGERGYTFAIHSCDTAVVQLK